MRNFLTTFVPTLVHCGVQLSGPDVTIRLLITGIQSQWAYDDPATGRTGSNEAGTEIGPMLVNDTLACLQKCGLCFDVSKKRKCTLLRVSD